MADLRAAHEDPSKWSYGVDVIEGKVADMLALGVFEPALVKEHAIKIATEAAAMILRIDDIIAASKLEEEKKGEEEGKGFGEEGSEFD